MWLDFMKSYITDVVINDIHTIYYTFNIHTHRKDEYSVFCILLTLVIS